MSLTDGGFRLIKHVWGYAQLSFKQTMD